MMNEQAKKVLNSMRIVALAGTMATVGAGCVTAQNGQTQAQQYSTYLDPRAEGFQAIKEAYENQGKKVEATFVPNEQGQMVAVYGVRDKTFIERTNEHLNANEGIYRNVERISNLGFQTTGLIYDVKKTHHLESIRHSEKSQAGTLRVINGVLQQSR